MSSLLGGSYAGYLVEFSVRENGLSIVPIPSRYVPDELIQWGQVPKSWEVLLSEEIEHETNAETPSSLRRKTIAILPAVGCGLDSLETIRTRDEYFLDTERTKGSAGAKSDTISVLYSEPNKVAALDTLVQSFQDTTNNNTQNIRLETIFALPTKDHRLRVSVEVQVTATQEADSTVDYRYKLSPSIPIRTYWERRYDTVVEDDNTLQTLAASVRNDVNGHLDAGTVFGLIGKNLRTWESDITKLPRHQEAQQDDSHNTIRVWKLPNQLTVITGPSQRRNENGAWYLEMSLGEETDCDSSSFRTTTVRREFEGFDCSTVVVPP